ncbi:hypothetical protein ZIOFF_037797 [Zingiber officinale]|uniref:Uncharacterized protein n=1 Tax=Zingiber officinale TaxID=94328 RepID=A0A8J5GFG9_ZINOF|nr:hypothetical protein ZIOFF_037797 [Zingiber officinale]
MLQFLSLPVRLMALGLTSSILLRPKHLTITFDFGHEQLLLNVTLYSGCPSTDAPIGFFAKAGVKVSHCPASAMRMLGFAPIKEIHEAGICVSLRTDGAPSNNRMSIGML